jgi:GT2 family glycosyltransferase
LNDRSCSVVEPQTTLAIIVLNWRSPTETLACLGSLTQVNCPGATVMVVDNGSDDDSVPRIRQHFPDVPVVETGANLGYAGGNNVGIHHALEKGAEFVCILNNDVTVEPDFLAPLLAALQSAPEVGVTTPLVAEHAGGGRVWALGSAVNWRTAEVTRQHAAEPMTVWSRRDPFEVEIVSGAVMLVKREVFERVGLMDEGFFLYFEEVDWSLIVRQAGYRILAVPTSVVWHEVSATLGISSPAIDYYMTRNHLAFITRHWPSPRRQYLWVSTFVRNLVTIAAFTVKSQGGQRTPHRNARLCALRDALSGKRGAMSPAVSAACHRDALHRSA